MLKRQVRHVLKNTSIINRPLPNSLLAGEPIVNTAEGIMYFSGVTSSTTSGWTQSDSGSTFWEVGSNLYDLKIRHRIIKYDNQTGTGLVGKFLSGTTSGFVLADISDIKGVDSYVTGGTVSYSGPDGTLTLRYNNDKPNVTINGFSNEFTTGATLIGTTVYFDTNRNLSGFTLDLSAFDPSGDTYVTAFTYNDNKLTISQNNEPDLSVYINSVTGLTVNGDLSITDLGVNRVVYTKGSGILTTESTFEYDDTLNKLSVNNIDVANDLVVYGDLTIFGQSVSAFTSQLYVEDKNITLNWNPTGNTSSSSIQAGWTIQDGDGLDSDVNLEIVRMKNLTGLTSTEIPDVTEYAGQSTGYSNRGWITQLNDIVIRSTSITDSGVVGSINGVRVLAEFDILDGGTY